MLLNTISFLFNDDIAFGINDEVLFEGLDLDTFTSNERA